MGASTDTILQGATRGAKYNVVLQVVFRIVTFVMNAVILRYVSKSTLGIANVRLMLLYTTALLFSREAIRKTAFDLHPQYNKGEHSADVVQSRNLSWCSVPAGALVTAVLMYVWTNLMYVPELGPANSSAGVGSEAPNRNSEFYGPCVALYAASVMLELFCDSLYIRCQHEMKQRVCVLVEGFAIIIRVFVTVGIAIARPDFGILAFGLGQLAFSITLCGSYFMYFTKVRKISILDLLPSPRVGSDLNEAALPPGSVALATSLFKQSFLKQFLTEGERFLMTIVANVDFEAQGVCVFTRLSVLEHAALPCSLVCAYMGLCSRQV